jgi:hypothetical protein
MIRFTITSGKLVLDPTLFFKGCRIYLIVLTDPFLQVIYYTHSTEQTTLYWAGC